MKRTDTTRVLDLLTQLTTAMIGPAAGLAPAEPGRSLSERLERLDDRVSDVQRGLATLAANTKAEFTKIDGRFEQIDASFDKVDGRLDKVDGQFQVTNRKIDDSAAMLKDVVERVHSELTGRIIDLELPERRGRKRGGSGPGGGGVPLAS
jgi:tetrahydromethanopterin S-methyltransferase subunit G